MYLVCFLQDFVHQIYVKDLCYFFSIQLHMTFCNVGLFFFLCEWFLRFLNERYWFLGFSFRKTNFFVFLCFRWILLSSLFISSVEIIYSLSFLSSLACSSAFFLFTWFFNFLIHFTDSLIIESDYLRHNC